MKIEERVKKREKRQKIQEIVLRSLYATAAIGVVVMAPNSAQLLRYVERYIGTSRLDKRMSQAFSRLIEKGLVAKGSNRRFTLTSRGERLAQALSETEGLIKKPLRWDGKWRIVIFDVWERRRAVRDRLRTILQRNGFVKVQNSVWAHPYDCEELFLLLRANLSLGRGILYIVAEEIEHDEWLRRHFHLRATR